MKKIITISIALLFSVGNIFAQNEYKKELYLANNDTLPYRILYPDNFSESEKYPLVLFLHGAGERGKDNEKQLVHGSKLFMDSIRKYPAVVVFPQCPVESYWANANVDRTTQPITLQFPEKSEPTRPLELTMELVKDMAGNNFIDNNRIYLGGLSMGGMGTFELLGREPDTFAAAFAICGGGNAKNTEKYAKTTPMWIFHGAKDNVVDPQLSIEMVSALLKYGGFPNFTLYSQTNHNSWDPAFAEPDLLQWLFSQSKND